MPARSAPPSSDQVVPRCLSPSASVPEGWPGAGWTTIPDGLSMTASAVVLVDDGEVHLRLSARGAQPTAGSAIGTRFDDHGRAVANPLSGAPRAAVDGHEPRVDQCPSSVARDVAMFGEPDVETREQHCGGGRRS